MEIFNCFAIIALAGLIHASFQLSVSELTLLSGHSLSTKRSKARLLRLSSGFVLGNIVMTTLLLSFFSLFVLDIFGVNISNTVWVIACGLLIGIGIAVWLFYYRRKKGTTLWIPRSFASYLEKRIQRTRLSAEAFGLGLSSVISELPFMIAPLLISALALISLPNNWQLLGLAVYVVMSTLSVLIVWVLISRGKSLARIQKWREDNKRFLQFTAGAGLIILGIFVYVVQVVSSAAGLI